MTERGQRSPSPLPIYERVVLKHVPTMVRRRYDSDLNIIHDINNQGSCLKDCEDDVDIGAKDLTRYVEASVGNELHEVEQDCKSRGEGTKDENVASYYMHVSYQGETKEHENSKDKQDGNVKDEVQDKEHGNFDEDKKDSTKGDQAPTPLPMYATVPLKHVPTFVVRKYDKDFHIDARPGLISEESKSEGVNYSSTAAYVDGSVEDRTLVHGHAKLGVYDQDIIPGDFLKTLERDSFDIYCPNCKHQNTKTVILRRREDHQQYQPTTSLCFHVEDTKSKGDGTEDESIAKYRKSEGDGIKDDNSASYYADGNVKDEVQDKEHGNFDEDKKVPFGKNSTKEDQAPTPSPVYKPVSLKHVPTFVVRKYDKDLRIDAGPGLISKESKSEGFNYSSNATNVDGSVEDRTQVHGHAKLGVYDQGLSSKSVEEEEEEEDYGAEDVNLTSYLDTTINYEANKHNEQDIILQDYLLKTLERDGYDIYCPNCKHQITQTVILRRREDRQHYQPTTCFSFLTSLFCCNRW